MRKSIPYKVIGGVRFYERKEVKDLLAYLRVIANPHDEVSLRRIINTPKRGLGDRAIASIDALAAAEGVSFWRALTRAEEAPGIATKASSTINEFVAMIMTFSDLAQASAPAGEIAQALLAQSGLVQELSSSGDPQDELRIENLEELVAVAHEYDESMRSESEIPTLSGFLEQVSLVADADEIPEASDGVVTLMTLHTAKGLEFPVVFLTGMEEGLFPHSRSIGDPKEIEEERRLAYVGLTRAREQLYLTRAQGRSTWGSPAFNPPSRFLSEVPEEVIEWNQSERVGSSSAGYSAGFSAANSPRPRNQWGGPAPAATGKRTGEIVTLLPGDRVNHDTFGVGKVVTVAGAGDKAEATIDFGSFGTKRLLLRYAPVEKLG